MTRRRISYEVVYDVLVNERHAHLALKELRLDSQDQAFVSALVYTTLQHAMYLEYQFSDLIDTKTPKTVHTVLLLAAAQHYKMRDIPDYAIVNESVNLVKSIGQGRYSGLVNAVLKKMLSREVRSISGDLLEVTSIEFSMPLWILKLLSSQYSETYAIDYAKYCQSVKPTYGWLNTLVETSNPSEIFVDIDRGIVSPDVFQKDYLQKGQLVIQDINSRSVVDNIPLNEGMRVLDCCCAPGTKTVRIANKLKTSGEIVGIDLHYNRVLKTQELMQRCNVEIATILEGDASTIRFEEKFDVALVDAPCSGLGVLSHKHDLRYHIKPDELDDLQKIQKEILNNISEFVKIDGLLVYATCTLNTKENRKQIDLFLESHPNYILEYDKLYNPMETLGDGFYVAHCRRTW